MAWVIATVRAETPGLMGARARAGVMLGVDTGLGLRCQRPSLLGPTPVPDRGGARCRGMGMVWLGVGMGAGRGRGRMGGGWAPQQRH